MDLNSHFDGVESFYAPGLKGPPGASSNLIVCLFVCPFVCNSVPLTNKVQYLKFGWWYNNQTGTVSSSMGSSYFHWHHMLLGVGRVKMWDLEIYAIFWLCCRWGHPCFTNTCLVYNKHTLFMEFKKTNIRYLQGPNEGQGRDDHQDNGDSADANDDQGGDSQEQD